MKLLHCLIAVALLGMVPAGASAEMYKYVDSKGRMHFTQDIGQVPPEYRNQVQRKELRKDISITGTGRAGGQDQRMKAMEKRSRRLQQAAERRQRQQAVPAARRRSKNPLVNAPEPKKYSKDCSDYHRTGRCRKVLTSDWQRWNAANGGNNGKPDIRRRVGKR